jgi:hypothetical protein
MTSALLLLQALGRVPSPLFPFFHQYLALVPLLNSPHPDFPAGEWLLLLARTVEAGTQPLPPLLSFSTPTPIPPWFLSSSFLLLPVGARWQRACRLLICSVAPLSLGGQEQSIPSFWTVPSSGCFSECATHPPASRSPTQAATARHSVLCSLPYTLSLLFPSVTSWKVGETKSVTLVSGWSISRCRPTHQELDFYCFPNSVCRLYCVSS